MKKYNVARGVTKTSLHLFRHTFAKTDFPTYDIAMRNIDIKKKKQKYNGLTYEKMFDHIRKVHGEEALNDFPFQMDLNHNEAGAYGRVKSWFLAEHADYKA